MTDIVRFSYWHYSTTKASPTQPQPTNTHTQCLPAQLNPGSHPHIQYNTLSLFPVSRVTQRQILPLLRYEKLANLLRVNLAPLSVMADTTPSTYRNHHYSSCLRRHTLPVHLTNGSGLRSAGNVLPTYTLMQ